MTGKQPDQASAQRGYCPEPLLTSQFLCLASTFARYRSVHTHHHWISTQIRLNWSTHCIYRLGYGLRVGIRKSAELTWRFWTGGNRNVSRGPVKPPRG